MSHEYRAALSLFDGEFGSQASHLAEQTVSWCRDHGAQILYPGHDDYPFTDGSLESPPRFLSYWGSPVWRHHPLLAVVGSRNPSRLAVDWLEIHLTRFAQKTSSAIVSGGACGIDQKAHLIAVRLEKPTIVFLPSGLAKPYPKDWLKWKDDVVASGGALVSINSPFQEVRKFHFERRNRLIAALSSLVFVVEARRKSGSSMTARLAREMNRTICCLPGSPLDPRCAGTVDLLFEGGFPVRDAEDLEILFSISTPGHGASSKLRLQNNQLSLAISPSP